MEGWMGDGPHTDTLDRVESIVDKLISEPVLMEEPKRPFKQINKKQFVWVTFQRAGFHYYPEAATNPDMQDISYLGLKHRHLFKFKVSIEVFHDDREIEFHRFLRFCENLLDNEIDIDYQSCEMLSDSLYQAIFKKYPREIIIDVSEDGECGSNTHYFKD